MFLSWGFKSRLFSVQQNDLSVARSIYIRSALLPRIRHGNVLFMADFLWGPASSGLISGPTIEICNQL